MKVLGYEGHGPEIGHLLRSARAGRLAHAYLFCGARGCGKKTLARLLAQALFCEAEEGKRPCGLCPACKRFLSGNHPDARTVAPKGRSIGVDDVRELINSNLTSAQLRKRARELGMRTLREDGVRKVMAGLTSADEVLRVTTGDAS